MDESQNLNESFYKCHGFTKVDVMKLSYEWKIYNFNLSRKKPGKCLKSPLFSSPSNINIKWYLSLFPNGQSNEVKDYISLYLFVHSVEGLSKQEIDTSYEFYILNKHGSKCCKYKIENTFVLPHSQGFGVLKFAKRSAIINDINLPNNCLTVVCDITAGLGEVTMPNDSLCHSILNDYFKYHLQLLYTYESFLNEQKFCDIIIIVAGKELHAHKVILAAHSPVFFAMFDNNMTENDQNKIEIVDIEFDVFYELLRFIYTEQIQNMDAVCSDLLIAADKYAINGLLNKCERYLEFNMNVDNILKILSLADNHNAGNLRKCAINFFIAHRREIIKENDILECFKTLKSDTIAEITTVLVMQ